MDQCRPGRLQSSISREPPRILRRLFFPREWSHDEEIQDEQIFPRSARTCGAAGAGTLKRIRLAVGGGSYRDSSWAAPGGFVAASWIAGLPRGYRSRKSMEKDVAVLLRKLFYIIYIMRHRQPGGAIRSPSETRIQPSPKIAPLRGRRLTTFSENSLRSGQHQGEYRTLFVSQYQCPPAAFVFMQLRDEARELQTQASAS